MRTRKGEYESGGGWKGWYWTATPADSDIAYALTVARWAASNGDGAYYKSHALPVRCVREDY